MWGEADDEPAVGGVGEADEGVVDEVEGCGLLGARVERSVLLPAAEVADGATVLDSVLGEGARIGKGAQVRELTVLGDRTEVAPGATLAGERIARDEA